MASLAKESLSLAQQNYNPGNLPPLLRGKWVGQVGVYTHDGYNLAIFQSAMLGFRALAYTMRAYQRDHSIYTIADIVHRLKAARSFEYKTDYIQIISRNTGIHRNTTLLFERHPNLLIAVCHAIAFAEARAFWWNDADLVQGIVEIGIIPRARIMDYL